MLSIRAIYYRYVAHHQQLSLSSRNLSGKRLDRLGRIEQAFVQGQYLTLSGWTYLDQLHISHANQEFTVTPDLSRDDVQQVFGKADAIGFSLTLHYKKDIVKVTGDGVDFEISQPGAFKNSLRKAALTARFFTDCVKSIPLVIAFRRAKNLQEQNVIKSKIKMRLGLDAERAAIVPQISDDPFSVISALATAPDEITIVLPVYDAFEVLQDCITRVFANTNVPWHLVIVHDQSSDERVAPYLQELAMGPHSDNVTLLENPENLGFVGAANRGLSIAVKRGGHVVLLNSDALVPANWAPRLLAPFADDAVASVTPLSNDAELMSVPCIVQNTQLAPGIGEQIDKVAAKLLAQVPPVPVPTGVGFCMAMSANWLKDIPQFDTTFGRGYGEEVDWCRKILAKGGYHVCVSNLFVEHRGGQSFGSAEKAAQISAHNEIISRRYPTFDAEVQSFIQSDPLIFGRIVQSLALAASQQSEPLTILVGHSMGGGADAATVRSIKLLLANGLSAVVIRLGGDTRFVVELHSASGITKAGVRNFDTLQMILGAVPDMHVVYGCGVGDPNPLEIPKFLVDWASRSAQSTLEIQFHDFFPVSPSYTLMNENGQYQGVPIGGLGSDPAHCFIDPTGQTISLRDWQDAWGEAVAAASSIRVYSQASADIVTAVWPASAPKLLIKGHDALVAVEPTQRLVNRPAKTIGILGNLGLQKGALIVSKLSKFLRKNDVGRIVVIGNIDPLFVVDKVAFLQFRFLMPWERCQKFLETGIDSHYPLPLI